VTGVEEKERGCNVYSVFCQLLTGGYGSGKQQVLPGNTHAPAMINHLTMHQSKGEEEEEEVEEERGERRRNKYWPALRRLLPAP
jgi:hypothetical protein